MARSICIYLTEECNLACTYCFVPNKIPKSISIDIAQAAIDLAIRCHYKKIPLNIAFFGGEPTIEFEMIKRLVEYSKKEALKNSIDVNFSIVTNGTLIDDKKTNYLNKEKFSIAFSLDGIDEAQDENRPFKNGRQSHARVMRGFNLLNDKIERDLFFVHVCITPITVSKMADFAEWLISKKVSEFAVVPNYEEKWSHNALNEFQLQLSKIELLLKKNMQVRIFPLHHYIIGSKDWLFNGIYRHRCFDDSLGVTIEGNVFPCHRFAAVDRYSCH